MGCLSWFCIGMWGWKCNVEAVKSSNGSSTDESISLAWIVISRTDFQEHASLHQWGPWWHAFHVWGCAKKWLTSNARPTVFYLFERLSSTVRILFPLQKFCDIFSCTYYAWKHKTIHLRTTFDKDAPSFDNEPES